MRSVGRIKEDDAVHMTAWNRVADLRVEVSQSVRRGFDCPRGW
jgi:hypothetical protein